MTDYRCIFAWPNHIDARTPVVVQISGGSWVSSLPLSNMIDPQLHRVARSSNATLAATQFDVDLGVSGRYIRVFALPRHTLSIAARVRVRGSSSPTDYGSAVEMRAPSGANAGVYGQTTAAFGSSGTKEFSISVKVSPQMAGVASKQFVGLYDATASVWRHLIQIAFNTSGVPTVTTALGGGQESAVAEADGFYRINGDAASCVAGNTHRLYYYGNDYAVAAGDQYGIACRPFVRDAATFATPYTASAPNIAPTPDDMSSGSWTLHASASWSRTGLQTPGGPQAYDTGWLDAWPVMWEEGTLPWGHPNVWTRRLTEEQISYYRAGFVHVAPTGYPARYWRWELDDTTNAAGYVDIARCVMSPGYQPSANFRFGAALGLKDTSVFDESMGGARYYDQRPQRRSMTMVFDLPDDEQLGVMQEMQRELGVSGQVFWLHAANDTFHLIRRSMLATLTELSPMEYAYYGRAVLPIALEEVL